MPYNRLLGSDMKKLCLYPILGILAVFFNVSPAAAENYTVVIYGDGLTAGTGLQPEEDIASRVQQKLVALGYTNVRVSNMSSDRYSAEDGAENARKVLAVRPDIVVIAFGFNDLLNNGNPRQIYKGVSDIIYTLMNNPSKPVYLILAGVKPPNRADYAYITHVASIYSTLAKHYQLAFLPDLLDGVSGDPQYTLADGVRPNSKGVDLMAGQLYVMVDGALRWLYDYRQNLKYQEELQRYNLGLDPSQPLPKPAPVIPSLPSEPPPLPLGGR
jgi:acyl-CoA thioesterase I